MKIALLSFSFLGFLLSSPCLMADDVVATVNGENIYKAELEEGFAQNKLFLSHQKVTREKVLNDLINRKIGIIKAKKNRLDKEKVVASKMDDILYHAQISKDLEPELKKITVSDDDVKNYYKDHAEYRTAHILLRVAAEADSSQIQAAYNQAMDLYKKVSSSPDTFHELANKFSQSTTSSEGGDLGYQPTVQLAPEYFQAIQGKNIGFITPPVRTQFGFHVIKVMGVRDFKDIDKNIYKKIVYDQKRDQILEGYFKAQREKAAIKITAKNLK